MDEFDKKLKEIVALMERDNIPLNNILYNNFISDELNQKYLNLVKLFNKKYGSSGEFNIWEYIRRNVKLDNNRIMKYYLWDIAIEKKSNLAIDTYPSIKENEDSDGLFKVPFNSDLNKNSFKFNNHYIIIHPLISRNFHLIQKIISRWNDDFNLFLPIDYDSLGIPDTRRNMCLKAHWQGPATLEHIKKSLKINEVVVKGPLNSSNSFLDKTEFLFEKRDGKYHLQIEELIPMATPEFDEKIAFRKNKIEYFTRYLHAITNEDLTVCFHLDGGLRTYTTLKNFKKRNSVLINDESNKRISDRIKLFKIEQLKDGITSFQEFIGLYFNYNPYITEFFEGESEETKEIEKHREEMIKFKLNRLNWN